MNIIDKLKQYGFTYVGKCGICQGSPEKWRLPNNHTIEFKVKPKHNSYRLFIDERNVMSGVAENVESAIQLIKLTKPDAQIIYP
jgi:hypothetical protein